MRILMLAHRIPYPPHTGDKVRAYQVARHLARGHELTLGFVIDDASDHSGIDALGRDIPDLEWGGLWKPAALARGLAGLGLGRSLSIAYFRSGRLARRVSRRLRDQPYDAVYVSSSPMVEYVRGTALPVVMDFVDVDSDKWTQYAAKQRAPISWAYRLEGRRLRHFEAEAARWGRRCILATAAEEGLLKSFAPWARTAVIPNGVDLAGFGPPADAPTVIFTGAMDYFPNVDAVQHFCTDIFPTVARAVAGARFIIVGLNPAPAVRRLGEIPGVTVTGAVPEVQPYYREASVCVAPLRVARGIQNKVLQSMALGVPVVASSAAARGLECRPGEHFLVEDDPIRFAERVIGLLRDREARTALAARARAFVEGHHSWSAALDRIEGVVVEAAGPGTARSSSPRASASPAGPAAEVSRP
jgi:sugar transferase (PEP-CTERM/EpsH1 system associated)